MNSFHYLLLQNLQKNLHFAPITNEFLYEKHIMKCFNGIIYAKYLLKQPSADYLKFKLINLPQSTGLLELNINKIESNKKTLFFDLDETLVSSTFYQQDQKEIFQSLPYNDNKGQQISVQIRPDTIYALEKLSRYFQIFIFSAGKEAYVNSVVQLLDPENKYICGALSQKHCLKTKMNMYIKDLRIISNRSLSEMIIVDNLITSFSFQIQNGIPIIPWTGDLNDHELYGLTNYLIKLSSCEDLSTANQCLVDYSKF